MEITLFVGLISVWGVVLLNLLLTLRLLRHRRAMDDLQAYADEMEDIPELPVGTLAPDFRIQSLSGEPTRLADYAGRSVAFIFVSPRCGPCRYEMPMLNELGGRARDHAGVELVLVSDQGRNETHQWINAIRVEDKVDIGLPILMASYKTSDFLLMYNPRGLTPYFCYLDERSVVQARDPVGAGDWSRVKREWEGRIANTTSRRPPPSRYR